VLARLFLEDNGYRLKFEPADAVRTMEMVATGVLEEAALAEWFRQRIAE
jgi:death on curing protein